METSRPIRSLIRQSGWLLRIASLLVPKDRRKAWHEKWSADVWHWAHFLHESGRLNSATRLDLTKHVCGAFREAFWLRFDRDKVLKLVRDVPRTPRFCLLTIAGFFLIAVIGSGFAPTVRSSLSPLPYRAPERLAHFSFNNNFIRYHLDSLFLAVSRWAEQSKTAEAVAGYSWESSTVSAAGGPVEVISARVSPDFFDVLGIGAGMGRLFHGGDEKQCANCIVISNHLWQYGFHHDPTIVGKQIVFSGSSSTVVGVLPSRFWFISPEISVWTVSPSRPDSFNSAERTGVVLRLRPGSSISQATVEFSRFVGSASGIDLTSIKARVRQGTEIFLVFTMLAFFGSLVLLAYRLVNSSGPKVHLMFRENYRWWMFFAAKTVLLLATCFLVSLEGTRRAFLVFTGVIPPFAGPVSAWLFLVTTILALTWTLHDQCRRCRLCLKRLGQEAYVGVPARLLLDWWGTELVCSQGHGILHVAEMHASWLEMEHWTPLDDSWKPLFESEDVKVS
ncbi:MAG TPA: ABC transporter permease [Candidatus Angelobacter sp.]|nr:ABC transporter permease [Candidatus Angelobacter sp.]